MNIALKEAEKAFLEGEIPVGACITLNGKVISRAHNCREKSQVATKHAEILAIEKACKKLHSWRLDGAEIYVTLEPCPMCAGAIANARIKRVIYAAAETTSHDHLMDQIFSSTRLNHIVESKFEENENAKNLLKKFFKDKRK